MSIKHKLRAVFLKGDFGPGMSTGRMQTDRYVPKALNGGPGWRVYDRKLGRHLSDREVRALPLERLESEGLPS